MCDSCGPEIISSIRRGTALLDREYPGWFKAIDLDELDMSMPYTCVLGQLEQAIHTDEGDESGGYDTMVDRLGLDTTNQIEFGFYTDEGEGVYEMLEHRWIRAIKWRLARG